MVVARFGFFLRALDDLVLMLWRSVERVEAQRLGSGIAHVVTGAGGHDHGEIVHHRILAAVDIDCTLPFLEAEELVPILVHLCANLLPWLKRHQHQLEMLTGVEDTPEVFVVDRQLVDVVAKSRFIRASPFRVRKRYERTTRPSALLFIRFVISTDRDPSS
jgi:hypothetical protein